MQCNKCLAVTSNKLAKKCPKRGCDGQLVRQQNARGFSVMDVYRKRKDR